MKSAFYLACLFAWSVGAQSVPSQPPVNPPGQQAPPASNAPEMSTREEPGASFKSHVNLVTVPVVVRDLQGNTTGNLTKANFQLLDKGKPQEITRFSVEKVGSKAVAVKSEPVDPAEADPEKTTTVVVPERYVAFLFDDVHLATADLARIREAALRHITTLRPSDRAAVFTMSGTAHAEFTDNQNVLRATISALRPGVMTRVGSMSGGEMLTLGSLDAIRGVIQQMAHLPGQRTLMVISPGFFTLDPMYFEAKTEILDQAIRASVIINGMDARGLYTDPALNASRPGTGRGGGLGTDLMRESMRADILAEMASGTGGAFFQNSNDYDEGFRRLAATPEYLYMLGFTPQYLKNDGSFHALQVVVKPSAGLNVQARRGYYAPKRLEDADATAKQEIENAVFSREELLELPMDVTTRFFRGGSGSSTLTVLVHLDLKQFHFRNADGRNNNVVTMVTAIFDRDGKLLQGTQKVLELHLKDETLAVRLNHGAVIRNDFEMASGTYLVRQVVRDAEGQQLSAANTAVVIP
jgi:VWFA-related protein